MIDSRYGGNPNEADMIVPSWLGRRAPTAGEAMAWPAIVEHNESKREERIPRCECGAPLRDSTRRWCDACYNAPPDPRPTLLEREAEAVFRSGKR